MNTEIEKYLTEFEGIDVEGESFIAEVIKEVDFSFPQDYVDFLSEFNGGEGPIGENSYLILWSANDLLPNNTGYDFESFAPGYFVIGQDAADTAYAIKKSDGMIYEFGFLANLETDPVKFCGSTFAEFIKYLYDA